MKKLRFWGRHEATRALVAQSAATDMGPWYLRRFEAAATNRLNSAHWQNVVGQSINIDLVNDLERIRARAQYEVANNPTLEGVIGGYCNDVWSRNGPKLAVNSPDHAYNEALEAVWRGFWAEPDVRGIMGGVDMGRLWVRSLWIAGEFLVQKVTVKPDPRQPLTPVGLKLKAIPPRRLATPFQLTGAYDILLGVRQTEDGQPVEYFVRDPLRRGVWEIDVSRYTTIPARDVIHRFLMLEEEQARGVPWLSTPLQGIADLRDYDAQVLDAARAAADQAVYLYSDHPDAPFLKVNEQVDVERRTISTLPPGWKAASVTPSQPTTNYAEYRAEHQRDIGRPANMPLMMVRLDSSNHNYSSARFDGQIYLRGLQALQGWLERRTLNGLVEEVRREAELFAAANPRWEYAAALRRRPRGEIGYTWTWPVPPHVDPKKEADAERTRMENGTLTYADACAANGYDEDEIIASRARTNRKLAAAGLPPLPTANSGGGAGVSPDQADRIQQLRDAAQSAADKGDQETADTLNEQADQLEAAGAGQSAAAPGAVGPSALTGSQITAMQAMVRALADGTLAPDAARELLIAGGITPDAAARIIAGTPIVKRDANADEVAYQREVVKAFLADKTVNDVFYNLTDIPTLMGNTGLPIDKAVQAGGDEAVPFLPIIAEPGQLVSGDVVTDPQGDIVGGDVVEGQGTSGEGQGAGGTSPPQGSAATPAADGTDANATGEDQVKDGAGSADQQPEPTPAQRSAPKPTKKPKPKS